LLIVNYQGDWLSKPT